jgi:Ca2+-binding RTX toxin-like protein
LAGKQSYIIGSDPSQWRRNMPVYSRLLYRDLWPGIDVVFHGTNEKLQYDLIVHPGARIEDASLSYLGADRLSLDQEGALIIDSRFGQLQDSSPESYQWINHTKQPVESRFVLRPQPGDGGRFGFALEPTYDPTRPVIIDPALVYSTFFGGGLVEGGNGIAIGVDGSAYVTGYTISRDFPTTPGAFDRQVEADEAFVTKFDPTGSSLVYSTVIGGSGQDAGGDISVAPDGSAYVTGDTTSADFPTTSGAFDRTLGESQGDAFVLKLNPTGSDLTYSTFLGGGSGEHGHAITQDAQGNAYVIGDTGSADFPTTPGAFQPDITPGFDQVEAFVTKLSPSGSGLVYSTFLGGEGDELGIDIGVDDGGNAYAFGQTTSSDFPVTPEAFDVTQAGKSDSYVTKFSPTGSALVYSTFLGGSDDEHSNALVVDSKGSAYVGGYTSSSDFPTTPEAFDSSLDGPDDAFVTKIKPAGSSLGFSTYLGGSGSESGLVGIDAEGNVYVGGATNSVDFPTTQGADSTLGGEVDSYVTRMDSTGATLECSSYVGGPLNEDSTDMAVDPTGVVYVTGFVIENSSIPDRKPSLDIRGSQDAFASEIVTSCTIEGSTTDDVITGTAARDIICGNGGNDVISGKGGSDIILMGSGNDTAQGGKGADAIFGEDGRDTISGGRGSDLIVGGSGADQLKGGPGRDLIRGRSGADVIRGGYDEDRLFGDLGEDWIAGGGGDDELHGGANNDALYGNGGGDLLDGDRGTDVCRGGPGTDVVRECEK